MTDPFVSFFFLLFFFALFCFVLLCDCRVDSAGKGALIVMKNEIVISLAIFFPSLRVTSPRWEARHLSLGVASSAVTRERAARGRSHGSPTSPALPAAFGATPNSREVQAEGGSVM